MRIYKAGNGETYAEIDRIVALGRMDRPFLDMQESGGLWVSLPREALASLVAAFGREAFGTGWGRRELCEIMAELER